MRSEEQERFIIHIQQIKRNLLERIENYQRKLHLGSNQYYEELIQKQSDGLDDLEKGEKQLMKKQAILKRKELEKMQHKKTLEIQKSRIKNLKREIEILEKKAGVEKYRKMEVEEKKKSYESEKEKVKENKMKYSYLLNKKERLLEAIKKQSQEIRCYEIQFESMDGYNSKGNTISTRDYNRTIETEMKNCELGSINQFNIS